MSRVQQDFSGKGLPVFGRRRRAAKQPPLSCPVCGSVLDLHGVIPGSVPEDGDIMATCPNDGCPTNQLP